MRCPSFVHQLVRWWEATQVELHGLYSIERMQQLERYTERVSLLRVLAVVVLTPLPCLLVVVLADAAPLEPPTRGIQHSQVFWTRAAVLTFITTFSLAEQCRRFIPDLRMTLRQTATIAVVVSTGSVLTGFGLATWIGFPLPFTTNVCGPSLMILFALCYEFYYGRLLRAQPSTWREVKSYFAVIVVQFAITLVYPAYISVFVHLRSSQQTAFALLLPVIKLAGKNLMSFVYRHSEDFKPEAVIFNAEVFHALFVACSMQSSTSLHTTLVLMLVDSIQFWISFRDVREIMAILERIERSACSRRTKQLNGDDAATKDSTRLSMLRVAIWIAKHYPQVTKTASRRALLVRGVRTHRWAITSIFPEPNMDKPTKSPIGSPHASVCALPPAHEGNELSALAQELSPPAVPYKDTTIATSASLTAYEALIVEKMSHTERIEYVHFVLKLVLMTEYLILVEFVEVIVP
ncbi:hypothetical protein Gpo141_00014456, partial [Globisporangium polare]